MPPEIKYKKNECDLEKTKIEIGMLGKFFGGGDKASRNIVGVICIILTLTIVGTLIFGGGGAKDLISLVAPLITLAIGYLVGSKN